MASKRAVKAGNAFIQFSLRDGKVKKQLRALQKRLLAIGSGLQKLGAMGARIGVGIAAGIGVAATAFSRVGDNLNKMSQRTGFSAQALSELGFAAQQSGTDLASVEKAVRGMQRSILDAERGLSTATDNLDDLRVSLADLRGKSPEQQFDILTTALSRIEDPSKRAALAMKLFGRAGSSLLPLLNSGPDGIAALRKEARDLGVTMSDEDAAAAAVLTDALGRLWSQVKQVAINVGAAVAGPLTALLDISKPIIAEFLNWISASGAVESAFDTIVHSAKVVGDVFIQLWEVTKTVWTTTQQLVNQAVSSITFALLNWQTIGSLAANTVLHAVTRFANQTAYFFTEVIPSMLQWFYNNWRDYFTDVANMTATIATNIWKNLSNLWDAIVGLFSGEGFSFEWVGLTEGFESAIRELPKIAEREIGPLEEALKTEMDRLGTELNRSWEDHSRDFAANIDEFAPKLEGITTDSQKATAASAKAIAGAVGSEVGKATSRGTFSVAALAAGALRGGGDDYAKRTAKAAEKTAENTKKIAKGGVMGA